MSSNKIFSVSNVKQALFDCKCQGQNYILFHYLFSSFALTSTEDKLLDQNECNTIYAPKQNGR